MVKSQVTLPPLAASVMPTTCVAHAGVIAVAPGQTSLMESMSTATAESLVIVTRKATAAPSLPSSLSP